MKKLMAIIAIFMICVSQASAMTVDARVGKQTKKTQENWLEQDRAIFDEVLYFSCKQAERKLINKETTFRPIVRRIGTLAVCDVERIPKSKPKEKELIQSRNEKIRTCVSTTEMTPVQCMALY